MNEEMLLEASVSQSGYLFTDNAIYRLDGGAVSVVVLTDGLSHEEWDATELGFMEMLGIKTPNFRVDMMSARTAMTAKYYGSGERK